jgi:hypothetical protein
MDSDSVPSGVKTVIGDHRAAQRLLVLGVMASTAQIVRCLRDEPGSDQVRRLMSERRRMLRELETGLPGPGFEARLQALGAAIAESDQTMEALLS